MIAKESKKEIDALDGVAPHRRGELSCLGHQFIQSKRERERKNGAGRTEPKGGAGVGIH